MKKGKIIILLAFLILFTGCSATVNYNIDNGISQNMTITLNSSERSSKTVYNLALESVERVEKTTEMLSEFTFSDTESYSTLKIQKKSSMSDYKFDNALAMCYDTVLFSNANNMLSISTDNIATCFSNYPMLDELTINLTTDYKVLENNADEVNNNVYTWKITKNNYTNKKIKLRVDYSADGNRDTSSPGSSDTRPVTPDNSTDNKDNTVAKTSTVVPILIMIGTILVISIILYIAYYFKNKKNNEI